MAMKTHKEHKESVYFSIDAVLFAGIIAAILIVGYLYYTSEPPKFVSSYFSQDFVRVFSVLTVSEANNSYINQLIADGDITRLNNTIIEQLGEFWAEGKIDLARNVIKNLSSALVPSNYGFGVWINDGEIYSKNNSFGKTKSLASSKKIISGIAKDKPALGFSAKVFFSGAAERTVLSYSYFGGFVGDGKISQYIVLPDEYKNITEAYMEFAVDSDFDFKINGIGSGSYSNIEDNSFRADKYNISPQYYSNFKPGINLVEVTFNNGSKFIGGGYIKAGVKSTDVSYLPFDYDGNDVTRTIYLPGVEGVINIYSSFFAPGNLTHISMYLNYTTTYPLFVGFGNVIIYDNNATGGIIVNISNSTIKNAFNGTLAKLSSSTIPLRIGHFSTEKLGDFARKTDAMIATDVSTSMDTQDVEDAPGKSRLDVAKAIEKDFVAFVLNKSLENRLGLVSYHSSVEPGQSLDLTNNNVTLKNKIDGYKTKSANTCFSCAIDFAKDKLLEDGNSSKKWAMILMSDGTADKCDAIPQSQCTEEAAKNESIQYACDAYRNHNITIYAVGYGAGSDNTTLRNVSEDCSDGLFFHSNNKSQLNEAFNIIAEELLSLAFTYQKSVPEGVSSSISPGSYIKMRYTPITPPFVFGKIPLDIESGAFGNNITTGTITIQPNVTIIEASVTSYSGDRWTESVKINGNEVFDLSDYNISYVEIGDPFVVNIPASLIQEGGNTIDIKTASGPSEQNISGGSEDDRIVYTLLTSNSLSFSSVAQKAEGCKWIIKFEDGTSATINSPTAYSGASLCYYQNGSYNKNDAIDKSTYILFRKLDSDKDGLIDIHINQQSLSVDSLVVEEVPSLWGPAIAEVRVWE